MEEGRPDAREFYSMPLNLNKHLNFYFYLIGVTWLKANISFYLVLEKSFKCK